MPSRILLLISLLFMPLVTSFAQQSGDYEAPRTQWGYPDLQGVWNFNSSTPLERPDRFGDREFLTEEELQQARIRRAEQREAADAAEAELVVDPEAPPAGASSTGGYNNFWYERASIGENPRTSLIIHPRDGQLPARVEGAAVHTANLGPDVEGERPVRAVFGGIGKDGPEDRGLSERCLIGFNAGPPLTGGGYNANLQIVQNRDHIVILTEMVHDARLVPLADGPTAVKEALADDIRLWSGDSYGYYEGDTLVVETRNFSEYLPSFRNFGNAREKTLSERFTRTGPYTVQYEWTLEDPATFTDTITATLPMTRVAGQLYEYGCHEGNYGMINILRGERAEERRAGGEE